MSQFNWSTTHDRIYRDGKIREAERMRQIEENRSLNPAMIGNFRCKMCKRIGAMLISWGTRLQESAEARLAAAKAHKTHRYRIAH